MKKKIVVPPQVLTRPMPIRKFLFSYFKKSLKEKNDFPSFQEVVSAVEKIYPDSVFNKKPEKHFSYYKSLYRSIVL